MLYQICHGAVSFADEEILHDINFEIRNTEKIAVVGRNGCGKTTLLKLIHGDVELDKRDSDEDIFIAKAGNPQIGYLKQIAFEDPSVTLEQEVRKVFAPMERRKKELEAAAQALETDYSEEAVTRYASAISSANASLMVVSESSGNPPCISTVPTGTMIMSFLERYSSTSSFNILGNILVLICFLLFLRDVVCFRLSLFFLISEIIFLHLYGRFFHRHSG